MLRTQNPTGMHKLTLVGAGLLSFSMTNAQRILPTGTGTDGTGINAMASYNGELVLGGFFANFNGHARRNIQGWDGASAHNDMAGAFDAAPERVSALVVFEEDLIAGGRETSLNNIARWDGSAWSAMGSGRSQRVAALCIHNGELYAGGLDSAVSRWNGTDWEQVGGRFNGQVNALASFGGQLHAGGNFTLNDEDLQLNQPYLSYFNGESWQEAGTGLNGPVNALLSAGDELYIGGDFTTDAEGNGSFPKWTRLSTGGFSSEPHLQLAEAPVEGIAQLPDGRVILGGASASLLIDGNSAKLVRFGGIRSAGEIAGRTLVGGDASTQSHAPVNCVGELAEGRDYEELAINNIRAGATPTPALFSDPVFSSPSFEADSISGKHTIYSASPWITGYADGVLHSAAPKYNVAAVEGDWTWAGPMVADVMDADFFRRYYQVWRVRKSEIDLHIANWDEAGYEMPSGIATWPGNGNAGNGEPTLLAPFADLDGDGLYEPEQGEYPIIRQDEALWYVMHTRPDPDGMHPHLSAEIQVMHYGNANAGDPNVFNTVHTNYQIINRGLETWNDVRFGEFTDFDIGCLVDDRVGCDSTLNLFFAFNGDGEDDNCGDPSIQFGAEPRAQGTIYLNHALTAHRYIPESLVPLADLMDGTQNGQPFTTPGYPTHFQYPGGVWTEESDGLSPGDRRSIGTIGPFTLGPGDTLCVDVAHTMGTDGDIATLQSMSAAVQLAYDGWNSPCFADFSTGVAPQDPEDGAFEVFPNPASGQVSLVRPSVREEAQVELFDLAGKRVLGDKWRTGTPVLRLDVSQLGPGMYSLIVITNDGNRTHRALVIE